MRRVGLAYALFEAAEAGVWIAMLVYAYQHGGASAAGVVAALQLIPAALLAPPMATLVDRRGPGRTLALGYVVQAAALAATAAALLAARPPGVAYALAVVASVAMTITRPSQNALAPALARTQDELTAQNAVGGWIESASMLVGPVLAGLLLSCGGAGVVFAVMAAGMATAAFLVAPIAAEPTPPSVRDAGSVAGATAGFRVLRADPEARSVIGLLGAQYVVIGAFDVLFVVLAVDVLDLGGSGAGYLNGAVGAGGVLGIAATAALVGRPRLVPALLIGIAVWSAACVAVAALPTATAALLLFALAGAGRSMFDVAGRTLLQRSASSELLGRVFGILEGLAMAGMAVGALLAPVLVGAGGAGLALVASGTLLPALALVYRRRLRAVDRCADVPVVEIALLRALPMMATLGPSQLERLARSLEPHSVRAGEVIIRQGDAADAFYVVAGGDLDVTRDGVRVAGLARPDGFGEIGLLDDRPRTATVRARAAALVLRLSQDDFLAAMATNVQGARAARRLADERLAAGS